jgi:GTP cyclohydrolase IA
MVEIEHTMAQANRNQIMEESLKKIIQMIGDDPERDGMKETPDRVKRALKELYGGYKENYKEILSKTFDGEGYDEIIVLRNIDFHSTCEHHLLPFSGVVHIGYLPSTKILGEISETVVVGASKLARVTDMYARRFQIQERMTLQIADAICNSLKPIGLGVVVIGKHLCMTSRGVKKPNTELVTSVMRGCFREQPSTKQEFLALLKI